MVKEMRKFLLIFLMFFTLLSFTSAFNFTDGSLVAYYPFNETTGTVRDVSMTGHDGLVSNAFAFNTSKYAVANSGIIGDTTNSAGVWFKTNSTTSIIGRLLCVNSEDSSPSYGVCISMRDANPGYMTIAVEGVGWGTNSASTYNDGQWHYALLTTSGTTHNLYIDNVLESTATYTPSYSNKIMIGANRPGHTADISFHGSLDEVSIFNTVIDGTLRTSLWNSGNGKSYADLTAGEKTNLVSYYSLDEIGSDPLDSHGSNDGELSGGTAVGGVTRGETGIYENAFDYDGSTGYTKVSSTLGLSSSDNQSYSFWFNLNTLPSAGNSYALLGKSTSVDDVSHLIRYQNTAGTYTLAYQRVRQGVGTEQALKVITLNTSQWYHMVGVYNRTGISYYLDGDYQVGNTATTLGGSNAQSDTFMIGANPTGAGFNLPTDGKIDEVLISNRPLNSTEISDLYNNPGYSVGEALTPTVTLVSPANGTTISDIGTNFTVSGNDLSSLSLNWTNVTYNVYEENNGTLVNSTTVDFTDGPNFTATQFIDDFSFQDYLWSATACLSNTTCYTAGNNTLSVSLFTIVSESWVNDTISGTLENFSVTIDLLEGFDLLGADLIYNGTSETPSITSQENNRYILVSDYAIPILTADENLTFYWDLEFTGGEMLQTDTNTQLVRAVLIDNCSTYTNKIFNISLHDEADKTALNGDIELVYTLLNTPAYDTINTLYFSVSGVSSTEVCTGLNISGEGLAYSAEIRYEATGYEPELYHIQRKLLPTTTDEINLYDLNSTDSTEFKITYQNSAFNFVEDAVVQLQRKYISEDLYRVVEAPLTSSEGTAIVHIDLDAIKYRAVVVKNGVVLDTFENLVFNCESELTGECEQKLLGSINPQNDVDYDTSRDFSYTISRDDTAVTVAFTIPSSEPSTVNIQLLQQDQFGGSTLCNKTVTSSGGSIECTFDETLGESYLDLNIYKNAEPMATTTYIIPEADSVDFLGNNYIIVVIIMLSLVGMALTSPEWMIINGIVTMLFAGMLWLVNGVNFVMGLGMLMWLVIAAGIMILKLAKQDDR